MKNKTFFYLALGLFFMAILLSLSGCHPKAQPQSSTKHYGDTIITTHVHVYDTTIHKKYIYGKDDTAGINNSHMAIQVINHYDSVNHYHTYYIHGECKPDTIRLHDYKETTTKVITQNPPFGQYIRDWFRSISLIYKAILILACLLVVLVIILSLVRSVINMFRL